MSDEVPDLPPPGEIPPPDEADLRLNIANEYTVRAALAYKEMPTYTKTLMRVIRRCHAAEKALAWHKQCHELDGTVTPRQFADGCAAYQRQLYGFAPDADELAGERKARELLMKGLESVTDLYDDVKHRYRTLGALLKVVRDEAALRHIELPESDALLVRALVVEYSQRLATLPKKDLRLYHAVLLFFCTLVLGFLSAWDFANVGLTALSIVASTAGLMSGMFGLALAVQYFRKRS